MITYCLHDLDWKLVKLFDLVVVMKGTGEKESLLKRLRGTLPRLRQLYGVEKIGVFGSFAQGTATRRSDVDLIVHLSKPLGWEFVSLAEDLEKSLGRKVHLATAEMLRRTKEKPRKQRMVAEIEQSLIYVE